MGLVFRPELLKGAHGNVFEHSEFGKGLRDLKRADHAQASNFMHLQTHNALA